MKAGQGFSGKKTVNSETKFDEMFDGDKVVVAKKPVAKKKEVATSTFTDLFAVDDNDT